MSWAAPFTTKYTVRWDFALKNNPWMVWGRGTWIPDWAGKATLSPLFCKLEIPLLPAIHLSFQTSYR